MKTLLAVVATVLLAACVPQAPSPSRDPSGFAPGAEPIPPRASLERFYQPTRTGDSTATDSTTEVVIQANFRSPRVWCSNLGGPPTRLSLSLIRHATATRTTTILLGVEYEAAEGLLVSGAGSLQMRLGPVEFHPLEAGEPVRRDGFSRSETMHYVVTLDDLRRIVAADTASVHLEGRAGRCDSPITGHARGLVALFVERELGNVAIAEKK